MAKSEEVRIAVSLPQPVRDELADVAVLLRMSEKDLITAGITAVIKNIKEQKGEKFQQALELLKAARDE